MPDIDGFETAELIRQHSKISAHADHLRHRVRRRDADRARLLAGRGRLHPLAGVPGDPAQQGEGVRRAVPDAAAQAPARRARRARAARRRARPRRRRRGARSSSPSRAASSARSLDLDEGMERLLQMLVPRLADYALLVGAARRTRRLVDVLHRRPARPQRACAEARGAAAPLQNALREARRSSSCSTRTSAVQGEAAPLPARSPLRAGERTVGAARPAAMPRRERARRGAIGDPRRARQPRRDRVRERAPVLEPQARDGAHRRPRRSCRRPTGARTSSSPCSRTSCATRSRRSATPPR